MSKPPFNRSNADVGNILALEHVNVTVPDQSLATFFYVNLMGFTRDPYMDFGPFNVWVNVGRQQFHLPKAEPQVVRGHIAVVVPNRQSLEARLTKMAKRLQGTAFGLRQTIRYTEVTCPWGNLIRCFDPAGTFGPMQLGIPYVEFQVPTGSAPGIARFYEQVMGCPSHLKNSGRLCEVSIGQHQSLRFVESKRSATHYDGHHIAVYVSNFSGPHAKLLEAGRITEESDANQYRFQALFDPESGETLFEIEHEVRSLHHPMYERPLINRNAEQGFFNYQKDRDAFTPSDIAVR